MDKSFHLLLAVTVGSIVALMFAPSHSSEGVDPRLIRALPVSCELERATKDLSRELDDLRQE
jgi:hypothetical protein